MVYFLTMSPLLLILAQGAAVIDWSSVIRSGGSGSVIFALTMVVLYFVRKTDAQQESIRKLEVEKAALEKERGAAQLALAQAHATELEKAKDEYDAKLEKIQAERLEEMRELVTTAHALVREARTVTEPGRRRPPPR